MRSMFLPLPEPNKMGSKGYALSRSSKRRSLLVGGRGEVPAFPKFKRLACRTEPWSLRVRHGAGYVLKIESLKCEQVPPCRG